MTTVLPDRKTLTPFNGVLITIRSEKSFAEVTKAIESRLQRFSTAKLMEYVTHADREGLEAYVAEVSAPSKFSIFWEFEQGSGMRLAGIPVESKFYLVGNAVIARGLFRYTGAAGFCGTSLASLSTWPKGISSTRPTLRITPRAKKEPNVMICATLSSP